MEWQSAGWQLAGKISLGGALLPAYPCTANFTSALASRAPGAASPAALPPNPSLPRTPT